MYINIRLKDRRSFSGNELCVSMTPDIFEDEFADGEFLNIKVVKREPIPLLSIFIPKSKKESNKAEDKPITYEYISIPFGNIACACKTSEYHCYSCSNLKDYTKI